MTPADASSEGSTTQAYTPPQEGDEPSFDVLRERLKAGDEAAFEHVFRRLSQPVFHFVCGMVQDESLAHDITQDTFVKLWSIRDRMDAIDSLRAYVFRMARNRVYNHRRDQQVHRDNEKDLREAHPEVSAPAPDEALDADLLRSLLEQWIGELPDRQREALTLRRRKDLSHNEIAEVMDVSPNTVNNHIVRAMDTLRDRLRDYRPDLLS